jgi:organic radical activating enzyme
VPAAIQATYRIAEVYLFDTCTHRCGYCWLAESGQVLDAAQLKPFRNPAFIEQVTTFFNSRTTAEERWLLQFTGGEPLLTPNLGSLCEPLFAHGNRVAFYTALLLPESHAGFRFLLDHSAPDVDYVMASLHPEAELDIDTYFRKIERLKHRAHRVIVRYVGHPDRLSQLQDIDARCRDLDVCFYPTTLLSNTHPGGYRDAERRELSAFFTSLSQHIQLGGGLQTDELRCHGGDRVIAVNLQTGNITPCITVDRPSLGNVFTNTLALKKGPSTCPVPGLACVCDIHFQQAIVDGVDDSQAFGLQKRGYVAPDARAGERVSGLPFFTGAGMGIGAVQEIGRLFFTKEEVKARWNARKSDARLDSLGEWSVVCDAHEGHGSVSVRLVSAQPIKSVELFLNGAADGGTDGEWTSIYSRKHDGSDLDLKVPVALAGRAPGRYRVALNVHFADGTACHWYNQPPHELRVST